MDDEARQMEKMAKNPPEDGCITVIMTTYNGERYLQEQLGSLLSQTLQPDKLVVSDNGSSDGTMHILSEFAHSAPFEVIVREHKAPDAPPAFCAMDNFMSATRHAEGDYFFFCDQDDFWLPEKIEKMIACMRSLEASARAGAPVLVACDFATTDGELNPLVPSTFQQASIDADSCDIARVLAGGVFLGCTMGFNAALHELLCRGEVVPEMWMHDIWASSIAASCGRFGIVPEVLQYYRIHGDNTYATDKGAKSTPLQLLVQWRADIRAERGHMLVRSQRARRLLFLFEREMSEEALPVVRAFADLYRHDKLGRLAVLMNNGILRQEPAAMLRELVSV